MRRRRSGEDMHESFVQCNLYIFGVDGACIDVGDGEFWRANETSAR